MLEDGRRALSPSQMQSVIAKKPAESEQETLIYTHVLKSNTAFLCESEVFVHPSEFCLICRSGALYLG